MPYGKVIVRAIPHAEHDVKVCIPFLREHGGYARNWTMATALAQHRQLVAGEMFEREAVSIHQYNLMVDAAPDTYLIEFVEEEPWKPTPYIPDFGEYQLLLVNGSQGDTEAAIEFCRLLLAAEIPLPCSPGPFAGGG